MNKTFYIVDDHELLRTGTVFFLETKSEWKCIGSSENIQKAIFDFEAFHEYLQLPSVLISDLNFYGKDEGFDFIKNIHEKYPDVKIIVFSMFYSTGIAQSAIKSGASGYVSKNSSSKELISCMEKVIAGKTGINDRQEFIKRFG